MLAPVCLRAYGYNFHPCGSTFATNLLFSCKKISTLFFLIFQWKKYNKIEVVKI